jgi:adenine-specific DNA-methyltransferase
VDFDFQHDTFMNQWQAYRTRKNRKLELESAEHQYDKPGRYEVFVKVVDIFGNDTSQLLSWEGK